jgi:hypothetical protein
VVVAMPGGRRIYHPNDLMEVPVLNRSPQQNMTSKLLLRSKAGRLEPATLSYPCGAYGCLDGMISGQGWIDEDRARPERERRAARARAEAVAKARADREAKIRQAEAKAQAAWEAKERERAASIRARGWPHRMAELVIAREVSPGMTAAMVLESWGRPEHVNRTITAITRSEQWVYDLGRYVYFDNDIVTSIQTSE